MTTTNLPGSSHLSKIFSEIIGKLNLDEVFSKPGRPYVYSTKSIIKAFLIMVAHRLTSVRSLARFLSDHPEIAKNCQFKDNHIPCYRTFCRRFKCLDSWVLEWCRIIITFLIDSKILKLKILLIDGTKCQSQCKKPREMGGRTRKSDPDARFGCNSRKQWFFGYKSIILATVAPLIVPLSWQVVPANEQEVSSLIPLVGKAAWLLEKDKNYELVGDAGYDSVNNYDWCQQLNIRLTCPLRKLKGANQARIPRHKFYKSKQGQKIYQRRTDIERLNGHLKDLFLIDPFTIKGLKNVNTYLSLIMLLYLACVYHNHRSGRGLREIKSLIA